MKHPNHFSDKIEKIRWFLVLKCENVLPFLVLHGGKLLEFKARWSNKLLNVVSLG